MGAFLKQINRSNGGLPKRMVAGPVALRAEGVEGDRQRDLRYHGGPDKAVLMIAAEVIEGLVLKGFKVDAGALGENLTVAGMDPRLWRAGQLYSVGEAIIELTTLRVPCATLHVYGRAVGRQLYDADCKAGEVSSPVWAYGGFYARVVREGLLVEGAPVRLLSDTA